MKSRISKGVPIGCCLKVADNAYPIKTAILIGVLKKNGARRRLRHARIGDLVVLARKKKMYTGVIIRTKNGVFRKEEDRYYRYEDNAVAIINKDTMKIKGTRIKGVISKEVFEVFKGMSVADAKVL